MGGQLETVGSIAVRLFWFHCGAVVGQRNGGWKKEVDSLPG